ncbi:4'-phosphopantetheinyl transferase family protein [Catenulispora pinisilvae]|uniref:4'-phosphopantetheinyl transferase family protein n=1 Tax=Catenulispora pinisilvae TaxID=2705253 RepID=UPI00189257A6|nr:4'-phosphopantetheinyl transferase superfamily protein [Catenulispora pinisilvae]
MTGLVTGVGVVSAWLVGEVSSHALARLSGTLDAEERRRAARLPSSAARRRFVIAHGALRQIVAERLGAPPADLTWKTGPNGKPELAGEWTGIHANLSHSGDRCLIAVSAQRAVGADIQRLIPGLNVAAMARRYFPEAEARQVADADADAETFARLWARKEAVTKAGGARLTQVLPLLTPEGPVAALGSWYRVADVDAPPGFRAAVALAGADRFAVEMGEWAMNEWAP